MTKSHWNSEFHESFFGFERIPTRVFLDTNVVNLLVKHAEQIFDGTVIAGGDGTLLKDVEALSRIFDVSVRANFDIRASRKTLTELAQTKKEGLRKHLLNYASNLVDVTTREECIFASEFGRRLANANLIRALPDIADRELLGNAIALGCDAFCTCDRATIVDMRTQLCRLPLRILTPPEWWEHVEPWASLWL